MIHIEKQDEYEKVKSIRYFSVKQKKVLFNWVKLDDGAWRRVQVVLQNSVFVCLKGKKLSVDLTTIINNFYLREQKGIDNFSFLKVANSVTEK